MVLFIGCTGVMHGWNGALQWCYLMGQWCNACVQWCIALVLFIGARGNAGAQWCIAMVLCYLMGQWCNAMVKVMGACH